MARDERSFYALCPPGLEDPLRRELRALGAVPAEGGQGGIAFRASLPAAWGICLRSRLAGRVLMAVGERDCHDEDDVYLLACRVPWENWFGHEHSFRVDVISRRARLRSLDFALLRVKDGICDRFAHFYGRRPDVDRAAPRVRVFAFIDASSCRLYLDLCGEALFKRGWRRDKGEAPLKENLAAGLLELAGWEPAVPLLDPFCGSGTIAIEAACRACRLAPGLGRGFLFENWLGFDRRAWEEERDAVRAEARLDAPALIRASDISTRVIELARRNAALAGLGPLLDDGRLSFSAADARGVTAPAHAGLIVTNPPYGERSLPKSAPVASMMSDVAANLKRNFSGWSAWLLSSDHALPGQMRLSEARRIPLRNGPLDCRLFRFDLVRGQYR